MRFFCDEMLKKGPCQVGRRRAGGNRNVESKTLALTVLWGCFLVPRRVDVTSAPHGSVHSKAVSLHLFHQAVSTQS